MCNAKALVTLRLCIEHAHTPHVTVTSSWHHHQYPEGLSYTFLQCRQSWGCWALELQNNSERMVSSYCGGCDQGIRDNTVTTPKPIMLAEPRINWMHSICYCIDQCQPTFTLELVEFFQVVALENCGMHVKNLPFSGKKDTINKWG
jgi:hypothetical protein